MKTELPEDNTTWRTPRALFRWLDKEFNFHLDAAASKSNALCDCYLTKEIDALSVDWVPGNRAIPTPPVVFVNPPYGRGVSKWIDKAVEQQAKGCTVVMLVSACTDTLWWSKAWDHISEARFFTGRVRFLTPSNQEVSGAPKGSAVLVWRPYGGDSLRGAHNTPLVTLVSLQEAMREGEGA